MYADESQPAAKNAHAGSSGGAVFLAMVREPIDPSWHEYLGDVQFMAAPDGHPLPSTVLTGVVPDFAAFIGVIDRLQNLGLKVLALSFHHTTT